MTDTMDNEIRDSKGLTEAEFLEIYKTKNYPKPYLTADAVILRKEGDSLYLLSVKRKNHPSIGRWAMPGGFAESTETLLQSAQRELMEETGVTGIPVELVGVYSKPGRDPRGWVVTAAYCAVITEDIPFKAADDAADAAWLKITVEGDKIMLTREGDASFDSAEMAFDHGDILRDALKMIKMI